MTIGTRQQSSTESCWLWSELPLRQLLSLALLSNLLLSTFVVRGAAQAANEYQVKAAFLYNFAKFVEWTPEAFGNISGTFVVGVIGDDPYGNALDHTLNGKSVNGRTITIRRLKWGQNLRECHILFICSSEQKRLAPILESLKGASVLTVSEMDKFNQLGGIINFILEDNKVRFAINTNAAEQARLKISSKLLTLAKTVIGDRHLGRN